MIAQTVVLRAEQTMRTFANQTEALGRYRGRGEQKMTVEHVHVYQGGQAIVGQVAAVHGVHHLLF